MNLKSLSYIFEASSLQIFGCIGKSDNFYWLHGEFLFVFKLCL